MPAIEKPGSLASGPSSWNPDFSHLYIEEGAREYPLTDMVRKRFPEATIVWVKDYRHFFNRPGQRFQVQKHSMKLVLAVKKDGYIYDGSENAQDFGVSNFYYTTPLINCIYNCDYCFLQGMYPSANLVLYVNQEDLQEAVKQVARHPPDPKQPLLLAVSYNTDLLAFEKVAPLASSWIDATRDIPRFLMEIRTKSANFRVLADLEPSSNTILAWTLSPQEVIRPYEKGTPPLSARLNAAAKAAQAGWKLRLCFDPVLKIPNWESVYPEFINQVFTAIPASQVTDITIGAFRMSASYFKTIKRQRADSDLFFDDYSHQDGLVRYKDPDQQALVDTVYSLCKAHLPKDRIDIWL